MRRHFLLAALAALLGAVPTLQAQPSQFQFEFGPTGPPDPITGLFAPSFVNGAIIPVSPTANNPFRVYLREITPGAPQLTAQNGMFAVNFDAEIPSAATNAIGFGFNNTPGTGFDFLNAFSPDSTPATAPNIANVQATSAGPFATDPNTGLPAPRPTGVTPDAIGRVFIGTMSFAPVQATTLATLRDSPQANGNQTYGTPPNFPDASFIDSQIQPYTVTFQPIPEPATLTLAGLGAAGLFGLVRRGRRSGAAVAA